MGIYNNFGLDKPTVADLLERFEELAVGELNQTHERVMFQKYTAIQRVSVFQHFLSLSG